MELLLILLNSTNSKQQRLTTSRFHSGGQRNDVKCYNSELSSHLVRQCPYAVRSRSTGTSADGAVMWNVGTTNGFKSMSSKSGDKTVRQPHKENSKDPWPTKEKLEGNQPRVNTEMESSNERAAESLIWKSRVSPRKAGVVT